MPVDERGAGRSAMQMEVRKLTVGYGAAWVLDQVSLQIGAGEFVGIVGCTGCGKTTLLKAMAGLLEVQGGEILLDGKNIFSRRFRSGSSAQKNRNGISVSGISAFCTNRGEGCGLRTEIQQT